MSAYFDVFADLTAVLAPALAAAAGENARGAVAVSLALNVVAAPAAGESVSAQAAVERATRTLVFVSGEALGDGGRRLAAASAVYRVEGGSA